MERNVKDSQELSIVAMLTKGTPKSSKVEFVFLSAEDSKELKKVNGELMADSQYSTAKTATCKFKPDPVPDDKEQYGLKYKVICDKEEFAQAEIIKVWPAKGKLEAKNADDKKTLANFQFKVVQAGLKEQPPFITDDKGAAEFRLQEGAPFTIEPVVPFEVKKQEATKLRELAIEAVRKFTPCFFEPLRPVDGKIKQYVNIATANAGKDGLGTKVKVKIAVQEDLQNPGKTPIGGPGVFAYVKVRFGGSGLAKKNERNDPKTELLAAGVTDLVAGAADPTTGVVEYTGKVELKSGGKGEFELELGKAGGDTCEISLGSVKDTWAPDTLTFTNWRKVYYELMAPKSIGDQLVEKTLADGTTKVKDFPSAAQRALTASGATTFVDYDCVGSVIYDVDDSVRDKCMAMKREFFELTSGPAEVAVLTDYTFTLEPGGPFAKPKTPVSGFKLCDFNLFAEPDSAEPAINQDGEGTSASIDVALPANTYWLPKSSLDGSDTIRKITWVAKITANPQPPAVVFDPPGNADNGGTDKKRIVRVEEKLLTPAALDLEWVKPSVGHIPTEITGAQKTAIKSWLTPLLTIANRRKSKNKLQLKITGLQGGSSRQTDRLSLVEEALKAALAELAPPPFDPHPGLGDDGSQKTGDLTAADVDMTASTWKKIVVKLPGGSDPAKLAGALSDTKCPIMAVVELKGHAEGLGLAGQGPQRGSLLCVFSTANPISATHITLHELAHQYNMTVYDQADNAHAPGIKKRSSTGEAEALVAYKENGDKGHYYTGKGHSGSHCAYGLSDVDKGRATYDPGAARAKCIMFGSNSIKDAGYSRAFCPQCSELIRARDLSALK
jgi:hypothetical protein